MNILIVKTSAYGDIIQSFDILGYLKILPKVSVDWVVTEKCYDLVKSHPYIKEIYSFDSVFNIRFISVIKKIRKKKYDVIFDLQGNCKSGLITFFSKGKDKVGFAYKNIPEWPNILATNFRIEIDPNKNIREQYLEIIKKYFKEKKNIFFNKNSFNRDILLNISFEEKKEIEDILNDENIKNKKKILVAPYSKWNNKEMDINELLIFLKKIKSSFDIFYFFIWGNKEEREKSCYLHNNFKENSKILKKSRFGFLQYFMKNLDVVISVDSSILHLSSHLKNVKVLAVFGPTSKEIYMPEGDNFFSYQGSCPKNICFNKRCSYLRSCKKGECIKNIRGEDLFLFFKKILNANEERCKK